MVELSYQKQQIIIYPIYVIIFVLASYLTSILTDVRFRDMAVFTATVVIYWFITVAITRIHHYLSNFRRLMKSTIVSLLVIIIVTSLQLVMFINIPTMSSISFFIISFLMIFALFLIISKQN